MAKNNQLKEILELSHTLNEKYKPYGFYWSKKSIHLASAAYSIFSNKDDIICDPFLGSGSSLYGIFNLPRKFIGIELNEMPLKLIEFNLRNDKDFLISYMARKLNSFRSEFNCLYKYPCLTCASELVLKYAYVNIENGNLFPTQFSLECNLCGKVVLNKSNNHYFKKYTNYYIERNNKLRTKTALKSDGNLIKNTRIAISEDMHISQLFSPINFYILEQYKKHFKNDDIMLSLLCGVLQLCKFTDKKSQSQFPYWFPKNDSLDRNILDLLEKKVKELKSKMFYLNSNIKICNSFNQLKLEDGKACYLLNKSVNNIDKKDLPHGCIDLVITDPPYFDQVAYSEYLKLWEYFTGYKSDLKNEIIVSQRSEYLSDKSKYLNDLNCAFENISKICTNEARMLLYFKDTNLNNMNSVLDIVSNNGFVFKEQCHVNKNTYTYKQNATPEGTLFGECMLYFQKNKKLIVNPSHNKIIDKNENNEVMIIQFIDDYLNGCKSASLSEILDNGLLKMLYENKLLDRISNTHVKNILDKHFCWDDSKRIYKTMKIKNKSQSNKKSKSKLNIIKKESINNGKVVSKESPETKNGKTADYANLVHNNGKININNLSNKLIDLDCITYLKSLPDGLFDCCITDPPYNISGYDNKKEIGWYKSNPLWKVNKSFNKINEKWDKFSNTSYFDFTYEWLNEIRRVLKPNANIIIFGSYHNIFKIGFLLELLDIRVVNSIVWYKRNAFPNITQRMFCESTEYIIWAVNNSQKNAKNWTFNYDIAKEFNKGIQMRNMWDIPMTPRSEKSFGKHPSQKPIEVIERLVMCCTNPGDFVVDPFCGSGTVPLVSKKNNRYYLGIDINPEYIELAQKRISGSFNNEYNELSNGKYPDRIKKELVSQLKLI